MWVCELVRASVTERESRGCHGFVYKQDSSVCWTTCLNDKCCCPQSLRTGAGDRCCNSASHARTDIYFPKPLSYETTAETRGSFVIEKKPKKDSLWILSVRHLKLNLAPVQMRGRLDYFFFLRLSSKACGVSLVLSDWGLFFFIRATNVSTRNKFNPTVFCVRSHWWYFLRFNFRYAGAGGCNMHT